MATFQELGIPFPLFEAPIEETGDYEGQVVCRLCRGENRHAFVPNHLVVTCKSCESLNGLDTRNREDITCRSCRERIPFPPLLKSKKQLLVCYDCLRSGKAAFTHSTEFGLVTWDQAVQGQTIGLPGLQTDQFEVLLIGSGTGCNWYAARIPSELLWELVRTPGYSSWQEEQWLFCCSHPMIYLGGWKQIRGLVQPDDPEAFFRSLFREDELPDDVTHEHAEFGNISVYGFRCQSCQGFRAAWDCD